MYIFQKFVLDGGDLTAAQHLQAEAAQLISDVKCKFRTSQKAVDYVVSGVDKLTDINIDVTKVENHSNFKGNYFKGIVSLINFCFPGFAEKKVS